MKFLLLILALQVTASGTASLTNYPSPEENDVAFAQVRIGTRVYLA